MQAQTLSQWTLKIKKQDVKFALQETHRKTSEKVLQGLRVSWFSQVFSVFVLFFLQVSFFSDLEMPGQQNRPKTCWKWCSVLPGSLAEGQTRKGTEHLKVLEGSGGIWRNIGSAWFCHTCDRAWCFQRQVCLDYIPNPDEASGTQSVSRQFDFGLWEDRTVRYCQWGAAPTTNESWNGTTGTLGSTSLSGGGDLRSTAWNQNPCCEG